MKKLIPWLIFINLLLLPVWVILIATAPKCDGTDQPICKNEPVAESSSAKIIAPPLATDIEAGINEYRISQGLAPLNSEVPALDQAASARADQMCAEKDWSHNKDWEILTPHYAYAYAGENLYYGDLREQQAKHAVTSWINSPTHQKNMVDNYNEMGVAVKSCPGFEGETNAIIVTNYFGVPR